MVADGWGAVTMATEAEGLPGLGRFGFEGAAADFRFEGRANGAGEEPAGESTGPD